MLGQPGKISAGGLAPKALIAHVKLAWINSTNETDNSSWLIESYSDLSIASCYVSYASSFRVVSRHVVLCGGVIERLWCDLGRAVLFYRVRSACELDVARCKRWS